MLIQRGHLFKGKMGGGGLHLLYNVYGRAKLWRQDLKHVQVSIDAFYCIAIKLPVTIQNTCMSSE